ncbi:hypothetical protein [Streptomyces sp. NPDC002758]
MLCSSELGVDAVNTRAYQPATNRTEFLDAMAASCAELDPDQYAFTRNVAGRLRRHDDRAEFLAGIELILAGATAPQ